MECGVRKLDYHEITTDIGKLPYLNFYIFWLYNIIDVVVQVCIEAQTDDLKYVFNNVIEMNTPFQKIFRQTNYLGTKAVEFYKHHEGVIIGNNINRFGKKPDEKFSGAFVADPTKISDKNKVRINGQPIYKYNNGNDFDYKRLYPSLMQEFNMATNTQVGKIFIDNPPYKDPEYLKLSPGGTFTENLASYNYIEFCHRWLGMMDVEEILQEIPKMNFIAVRGKGNPNEKEGEYQKAVEMLYGVAYTLKMSYKTQYKIEGFFEYVVPPLEGLWWQENVKHENYLLNKELFNWISLIRVPDFIKKEDVEWAIKCATEKKKKDFSKVEFFSYNEGLCVQCMHIGSYNEEPETIQRMNEFVQNNGYNIELTEKRYHHEIYLGDPRKTDINKLKTVIRQPVKK